jgi:hypothetical protein
MLARNCVCRILFFDHHVHGCGTVNLTVDTVS